MPENIKHETRDLDVPLVSWIALGLVVAVVLIFLATHGLFHLFRQQQPSLSAPSRIELRPRMIAPAPQLQANPAPDLAAFRAAEDSKLDSYGWIDKTAGVIRIPIERAMDLISQRGLPTRGLGTQNSSGKTPEDLQREKAAANVPKP